MKGRGQDMALAWWQNGVVYQVYPRSFQDTDGDGTGDLPGIIERLDYFVWLGVDAVWLSPVFPSPMTDFGYDVSDYCDIDPLFGTLADMDALIAAAHARGLKIILDYVPNHTSDQHPWFIDSRRGRASAKRDWYIWHDGAPGGGPPNSSAGGPPNNWQSHFGGAGWTWDAGSRQYLLPFVPADPAGAELAQSAGARRHARCLAVLAGARRRWIPRRCHVADDQGRPAPRQSAEP